MSLILKLRYYIVFLLIQFCFLNNLMSQDLTDFCVLPDYNLHPDVEGSYSFSNDPQDLIQVEPLVLNVYFWRIRDQYDNPHPDELTEYKALEAIQYLNIHFNPSGIYFKYRGLGSFASPTNVIWKKYDVACKSCINLPEAPLDPCSNTTQTIDPDGFAKLSQCQIGALRNYGQANGYMDPNSINIYVPRVCWDFGGYGGSPIITPVANLSKNTFIHEMGHYFSLSHPHSGWIKQNSDGTVDPNYVNCEHVTRDVNDPNYNASGQGAQGDQIHDTAAMPQYGYEYCMANGFPNNVPCTNGHPYNFYYYDKVSCSYIGDEEEPQRGDCQDTPYDIDDTQARNTMSYAPGSCRDNFTVGQAIKMREAIISSSFLQDRSTTVAALYEPYKGEYYVAGPVDGGLMQTYYRPLFQPGFDYYFLECDCNPDCAEPSPYEDTSFSYTNTSILSISKYETNFNLITHPNHSAIKIIFPQNGIANNYYGPRRCYDNWNRAPSGGSVTRFNDGVFNANVTITPQDSTSINNPALINNLQPGLYKIEKTYDDGAQQQNIIVKENN